MRRCLSQIKPGIDDLPPRAGRTTDTIHAVHMLVYEQEHQEVAWPRPSPPAPRMAPGLRRGGLAQHAARVRPREYALGTTTFVNADPYPWPYNGGLRPGGSVAASRYA